MKSFITAANYIYLSDRCRRRNMTWTSAFLLPVMPKDLDFRNCSLKSQCSKSALFFALMLHVFLETQKTGRNFLNYVTSLIPLLLTLSKSMTLTFQMTAWFSVSKGLCLKWSYPFLNCVECNQNGRNLNYHSPFFEPGLR